jgi:hypothetical protein
MEKADEAAGTLPPAITIISTIALRTNQLKFRLLKKF